MTDRSKPSIFIVEDETIVAQDIRDTLKSFGYSVPGIAKSGEHALEKIPECTPDLILMDIHLAGPMDGIDTAECIYQKYRIPVIFLTAYSDDVLLERAKRTHPFGYIIKPFSERELYSVIELALYKSTADERIRESEQKYRGLFESIPDGFSYCRVIPDENKNPCDAVILDVNPAFEQMTGFGNVSGKRLSEVFQGNDRDIREIPDLCLRVAATGAPETREVRCGPQHLWLRVLISRPAEDYLTIVFQDITVSKLATDALRLSNQKLSLLYGITRHDIRNQIQALYGYLGLLKLALGDGPGAEYVIKGAQVADTIERQITFTKEYEDLGVRDPTWQEIGTCVGCAITALPLRGVRVDVPEQNLEILADPLLGKVFYNLIDNALRYGGDRLTRIHIGSRMSDTGETIIIEDDGKGISDEDKPHLFTKGFGKNTGLGLFLSREILAITDITIAETSLAGEGARFEITVPDGAWRCAGKNTE
jgi:signal transduction histidine kinase/AmiR/NasT family two-component response regulator